MDMKGSTQAEPVTCELPGTSKQGIHTTKDTTDSDINVGGLPSDNPPEQVEKQNSPTSVPATTSQPELSKETNSAVDVTPSETVGNTRQQLKSTPAPPQAPAEKQTSTNTQTTTCLPNTKKHQSAVDVTTGNGGNDGQRQNTSTPTPSPQP